MSVFKYDPYMVRPTLIDINPIELKYHTFVINLNKCTGKCNVWSWKICVPKEAKDMNVEGFNMITNKNEAKAMTEHISCEYKCKFIMSSPQRMWWGGRLLSRISLMFANDNNRKKELDLFYLLHLLNVTLVPDLFAEIHKSCVKFALPRSPYTFRFQLGWGFLNHNEFKN